MFKLVCLIDSIYVISGHFITKLTIVRSKSGQQNQMLWRCSSLPTNDTEQMVSLLSAELATMDSVMSDCDSIVTIHILCITVDQILP